MLKQLVVPELGRSKDILREYTLLHQLDHPNVIQCYGYFTEPETGSVFLVLARSDSSAAPASWLAGLAGECHRPTAWWVSRLRSTAAGSPAKSATTVAALTDAAKAKDAKVLPLNCCGSTVCES